MTRRIRAAAAYLAAFCLFFAIAASSAFAQTDGQGLLGETDDKMVTFISFGVLLFFVFVITIGTIIQSALEKRKEEKKAARLRQRTGW
jgi:nitrogen fixation/metabolism regulation signal transduction histidine kinase